MNREGKGARLSMVGATSLRPVANTVAVENWAAHYLVAAGGDRDRALWLAVADLLRSQDDVLVTAAALDRWTSRGYVRGRATDRLGLSSAPDGG